MLTLVTLAAAPLEPRAPALPLLALVAGLSTFIVLGFFAGLGLADLSLGLRTLSAMETILRPLHRLRHALLQNRPDP